MFALTATPMPTPSMTVKPEAVTPGFIGFAVIVVIVIAVILLIWDMNRRIRRVRYRDEVREELDAEEAARAAHDATAGGTSVPETDGTGAQDADEEPPTR
jgi:hypothetical protein